MHIVIYAECHKLALYAQCHYAECHYDSYLKLTIGSRIEVLQHSGCQFSKSFENLWKKVVAWEFFSFFFARIEMFLQ
jgi:hypothetical protein